MIFNNFPFSLNLKNQLNHPFDDGCNAREVPWFFGNEGMMVRLQEICQSSILLPKNIYR